MRQFYLLSRDNRPRQQEVIADSSVAEMAAFRIWQCEPTPVESFERLVFRLRLGTPSDFVHCWQIISPRMLAVLRDYARQDVQVINVDIRDSANRPALPGFALAHVVRGLENVADVDFSLAGEVNCMGRMNICQLEYTIRAAQVPAHVHLFKPKEITRATIVSEELAAALRAAKLSGVTLSECKSV